MPSELGMAVMKSLMAEARVRPRIGWVRADQARSEADIQRERRLVDELEEAKERIEELEREIRDRAILKGEVPQELLAQGDDIYEITVIYLDQTKKPVREEVQLTWDELFKVIGPPMYGYILRRSKSGGSENSRYSFEDNLQQHIRTKIIDRVQNRRIKIEFSQVDTCILQFKELGLMRFAEKKEEEERYSAE
jgi:hypothetical protein